MRGGAGARPLHPAGFDAAVGAARFDAAAGAALRLRSGLAAFRSAARLAFLGVALVACDKGASPSAPAPSAGAATSVSARDTATNAVGPNAAGPNATGPDAATPIASASSADKPVVATDGCGAIPASSAIRAMKNIGHTSVVFQIELASGQKLAFKPSSKRGKDRWRGEIAAFKLDEALGLGRVPPACMRTYPLARFKELLPNAAPLDEVIAADDGTVTGAAIPWITGLQFLALEKEPLRTQTKDWLGTRDAGTNIPAEKLELASQLSTMMVFDAITGNWDRYSGGNVGLDASGKNVLFIDNDAAFMEGAPLKDLAANVARIEGTERFSRSFVKALRSVDVHKAFGTLPNGTPLLPEPMLKTIAERIDKVLKIIDAKIAKRSEADVLPFP